MKLDILEENEPIHRAAGNKLHADMDATQAADIRQALAVLQAASAGPIWPEPKQN